MCDALVNGMSLCLDGTASFFAEIAVSTEVDKKAKPENEVQDVTDRIVLQIKVVPEEIWKESYCGTSTRILFVNPLIMEQLQVKEGVHVEIMCYHKEIDIPDGFVLHTTKENDETKKQLQMSFLSYLKSCLSSFFPIIMNQGTLLIFQYAGQLKHVVVELIGVKNAICGKINEENIDRMFVAVDDDEK